MFLAPVHALLIDLFVATSPAASVCEGATDCV